MVGGAHPTIWVRITLIASSVFVLVEAEKFFLNRNSNPGT